MKSKSTRAYGWIGAALSMVLSTHCLAQNTPTTSSGVSATPDAWLLAKNGPQWWYRSRPSPQPAVLSARPASAGETAVVERARQTFVRYPQAKAMVLMDGNNVVLSETKAPADPESLFFGMSMGKTVTAMAVGQAICAGKIKLDTKASDVMPELQGKALGSATVHDLLRMAAGTAEVNPDSSIWTPEQFKEWGRGQLNLVDLVTSDRVTQAARGVFSEYKPGEHFAYKATDPVTLGIMVSRAVGMPWNQWIQTQVLDPMGTAHAGLYVQDRAQNGAAEAGMRLRLEDWMRFAVWVKESSKKQDCFGNYVRSAMRTQISNGGSPATRKTGKLFGGYGYFTWTENAVAPNTAWASGWGGQRIGWNLGNDRMVVVFSNEENWMDSVYEIAKGWGQVQR